MVMMALRNASNGAAAVAVFAALVFLSNECNAARRLHAVKDYNAALKTCTSKLQGVKAGCDFECPKHSCVKAGKSCVKDFSDCECKPGYHKPRSTRFTTAKVTFSGSGVKEGKRLQSKVGSLAAGELGYCVASHGRSQMAATFYKTTKLHTKTPYLPQTIFTQKGKDKRLAPNPNPAFRFNARSRR